MTEQKHAIYHHPHPPYPSDLTFVSMAGLSEDGASGGVNISRSFEEAKSTLYGTISAAGVALESASRRRKFTVKAMKSYLDRIQLDVSGLSVIHVTGTKGKGSTCALVESVLRRHGFRTGLFSSPHLLEVTERVRLDGKPLSKEAFARYFFEVWDRLQASRSRSTPPAASSEECAAGEPPVEVVEMPGYFQLLTLVGLWCFAREGVDVCVVEVGMGGRFDATNVVASPVACGVAMLDLDHTQVLGDTLDKIAWEKGGIFRGGCQAFTVEQPRGGMSVLRKCAEEAGCGLQVVGSLPTHDPTGAAYEIGLAGEHQRVNAGLALRLCATWIEARRRQPQKQGQGTAATTEENAPSVPVKNNSVAQDCVIDKNGVSDATSFIVATNTSGETNKVAFLGGVEDVDEKDDSGKEALLRPVEVHRGLSECAWPGRCQVFRSPALPFLTVYLDGAHTEQSMRACLEWFDAETTTTARACDVSSEANTTTIKSIGEETTDGPLLPPPGPQRPRQQQQQQNRLQWRRRKHSRRVLLFHTSHERNVFPLLEALASARAASDVHSNTDGDGPDNEQGKISCGRDAVQNSCCGGGDEHKEVDDDNAPLFDEAWFIEVPRGRPSRHSHPSAEEILAPYGVPLARAGDHGTADGDPIVTAAGSSAGHNFMNRSKLSCSVERHKLELRKRNGGGPWQHTLEQVWTSLQRRKGGKLTETRTCTAPDAVESLRSMEIGLGDNRNEKAKAIDINAGISVSNENWVSETDRTANDEVGVEGALCEESDRRVEVLCTGSLFAVAATLEAFGAEVV